MTGDSRRYVDKKRPLLSADDAADLRETCSGQHAPFRMVLRIWPKVFAAQPGAVSCDPGACGHRSVDAVFKCLWIGDDAAGFNSGQEAVQTVLDACASRIPNSLAESRIEAPLRGAWRLVCVSNSQFSR